MTGHQVEVGTARQRLELVRDRAWLVSDAAVASAIAGHAFLPVRDVEVARSARLIAFVLGIIAAPSSETLSIAALDIPVDVDALGARLAMPKREVEDALRVLLVSGVLVSSASGGALRFASHVVPPSGLAAQIQWPVVLHRLTMPPREGTQAALLVFRIFLERLHHPAEQVPLPRRDAAESLGLSGDQIRRGVRALVETGLWEGEHAPGRRGRYALGRDVLIGAPAARVEEAIPAAPAPPVQEATTLETSASPITPDDDLVLQVGDRRILVPASIKELRLPDRAVRAVVEVDPESHEVRIVLG